MHGRTFVNIGIPKVSKQSRKRQDNAGYLNLMDRAPGLSNIRVEVQEIVAEMGQSNPDTPVDVNKIYLDVLGGGLDKKQRLFGTGSLALTLKTNISGESSTSAMSDIDKEQYATRLGDVEEQLQEERERTSRLEEQVKVAMEIIKQLQGQSSSATSHPDQPSRVP